jgi:NAD(P)-dependent dehydrogenase (short-subunit alcohol dehydrogenase family)
MQSLRGKVAVVTGGSGGLGSGISKGLAAEGVRVVVNDVRVEEDGARAADKVVAEIEAAGGEAVANADSVASFEGGEKVVQAAVDNFGRLDIIVMPAGNLVAPALVDLTQDEWDLSLSVHLTGTVSCARAAARQMIAQGDGGRIITFGSRAGFRIDNPELACPAYAAAKAGIMGVTHAIAVQLAEHRITVNCVLPSAQTPTFNFSGPRTKGGMPPQISMDPDYVAPAVVFLASPEAEHVTSRYVYASGGDVCIYPHPFSVQGASALIRKQGKWTPDELAEALPPMFAVGAA